jgi:hypothetical protein
MGGGAGCQSQEGVAGDLLKFSRDGAFVTSTTTAADGSYRVDVPAGLYDIGETRGGQNARVKVEAGKTVVANFTAP